MTVCLRWSRASAACSATRRSAASSPSSCARAIAPAPCSGAWRRCSMIHSARRARSAACAASRSALRQASSAPARACSAALQACSTAASALAVVLAESAALAASAASFSRRWRSARTCSPLPSALCRSSPVVPFHARPSRVTATPTKSLGRESSESTSQTPARSLRPSPACLPPVMRSASERAPARDSPALDSPLPVKATSAEPPSDPSRASSC